MTRTIYAVPSEPDHRHRHGLGKATSAAIASIGDKAAADHTHPEIAALAARVVELEAARHTHPEPPPADPPPPIPPSVGSWAELVAAIAATSAGGVVDCGGETFAAPDGGLLVDRPVILRNAHLTSTRKSGSAANGVVRVTADGTVVDGSVEIEGGFVGIAIDRASDVIIRAVVRNVVYGGVMTLSARDCLIEDGLIDGVRPISAANGHNAYGISATKVTGQPVSERITVRRMRIANIPTWIGVDTHGGTSIHVEECDIRGVRRAVFVSENPVDLQVIGNRITCPTTEQQHLDPATLGGVLPTYLTDVVGIYLNGGSGRIEGNQGLDYPAGRWFAQKGGTYTYAGNIPVIP